MIYFLVVIGYFFAKKFIKEISAVALGLSFFFTLFIPVFVMLGKPDAARAFGNLTLLFYILLVLDLLQNAFKRRSLIK